MKNTIQAELQKKLARKRSSSAVYRMVKAEAPSTSANLGPGFDVFGLALDLFYDRVEIELVAERGRRVSVAGVGCEAIPTEVQKNTAGCSPRRVYACRKSVQSILVSFNS